MLALAQTLAFGFERGQAFVVGVYRQVEAAVEPAGKLLPAIAMSLGVPSILSVMSYNQRIGLPFAHQRLDSPVRYSILCLEYAQLTCLPGNGPTADPQRQSV